MCLKVKPPWGMPRETEIVGKALLREESPYRLIGEQLFNRHSEEEYADLYSAEGKPGISPIILAFLGGSAFRNPAAHRNTVQLIDIVV